MLQHCLSVLLRAQVVNVVGMAAEAVPSFKQGQQAFRPDVMRARLGAGSGQGLVVELETEDEFHGVGCFGQTYAENGVLGKGLT